MNALEGLKVLELGQLIAGPFAGQDTGGVRRRRDQGRAGRCRRPAAQVAAAARRHLGMVGGAVAQQAFGVPRPAQRRRAGGSARAGARGRRADRELQARHARRLGPGVGAAARAEPAADHAAHLGLWADRALPRQARLRRARRIDGRAALPERRAGAGAGARGRLAGRHAGGAARRDRRADGAAPPRRPMAAKASSSTWRCTSRSST